MEELSEDDKMTVAQARKMQRFLTQPMFVAEQFTGGRQVRQIEDTVRGFREILKASTTACGSRFLLVGGIEEALEAAERLQPRAGAMPIQVDIVTPDKRLVSDMVDSITLPGVEGRWASCMGMRRCCRRWTWRIVLHRGANVDYIAVTGGVVEVRPTK